VQNATDEGDAKMVVDVYAALSARLADEDRVSSPLYEQMPPDAILGLLAQFVYGRLDNHPAVTNIEQVADLGGMQIFGLDVVGIPGGISVTIGLSNPPEIAQSHNLPSAWDDSSPAL
jgi:hypothetical protein